MKSRNLKKYFFMIIGHIGLLFLGLGMMRYFVVFEDSVGQWLILFGILFVSNLIGFLEHKAGVTTKESLISSTLLVIVFILVTVFFFF